MFCIIFKIVRSGSSVILTEKPLFLRRSAKKKKKRSKGTGKRTAVLVHVNRLIVYLHKHQFDRCFLDDLKMRFILNKMKKSEMILRHFNLRFSVEQKLDLALKVSVNYISCFICECYHSDPI